MRIELNGERVQIDPPASVEDAMRLAGVRVERGVAVALDGEVVRRADWPDTALADGATLEVVQAVQGG